MLPLQSDQEEAGGGGGGAESVTLFGIFLRTSYGRSLYSWTKKGGGEGGRGNFIPRLSHLPVFCDEGAYAYSALGISFGNGVYHYHIFLYPLKMKS